MTATIPKKFTVENVLDGLKIAYKLDLLDQKKAGFAFLWDHVEELAGTRAFNELLVRYPGLMSDFIVKPKQFMTKVQDPTIMETKLIPFTSAGPKDSDGNPVLVGTLYGKAGLQELTLPENLPQEARGVRIIVAQELQGGLETSNTGFVKVWSVSGGEKFLHFLYKTRQTEQYDFYQAPELYFPIDGENRQIFVDASEVSEQARYENYYVMSFYLVGYTE